MSFLGCLAATLYLTAMLLLQKATTNVDCSGCYLIWVATVSRASFTLCKCEVMLFYCDKIQQIKSYYSVGTETTLLQANLVIQSPCV